MTGIRKRRMSMYIILGIIAILFLTWPAHFAVAAPTTQALACSGSIIDANQVMIDCAPGYATAHDRIVIYRRAGTDRSKSWHENLDQTNSIWIFEVGAQARASLIIDFHPIDSGLAADLYLDQNADNAVDYVIGLDGSLEVREKSMGAPDPDTGSTPWMFRVIARDGWWEHNGITNFNLDIEVDGSATVTLLSDIYLDKIKTDGVIDFTVHVRDQDIDGRPDYEWREAFLPFSDNDAYYRTSIIVNTEDDELPISGSIFWPYLGNDYGNIIKPYNGSPPPLEMNWRSARINFLGEFVASRANPGSFFIYSFQRLKPNKILEADHENPFAFYNLAKVDDGYPDLSIRFENYFAHNRFFMGGKFPQTITEIEYTWDQDHFQQPEKSWSYMVGLLGRNPIETFIELPEFSVRTIPYEQAPYWATENTWDAATFVAVEKPPLFTSEHIYTWTVFLGAQLDLRDHYITGIATNTPDHNYQDIQPGLRGEYNFHLFGQPWLYLSPIDRKLHLLTAHSGIWRIDERYVVRYANLRGIDHIDSWRMFDGEKLIHQLYAAPGFLISDGDGWVILKAATYPDELFRTLPPRNHNEWVALRERLRAHQHTFAPDDFQAMLDQFAGPTLRISAARLRDYRPLGARGFRFVLTLLPGFQAQGDDLLGVRGLPPGTYAVSYDGAFHVAPLTPPSLSAAVIGAPLTALEPHAVEVRLNNAGLQDVPEATLELWAAQPGSEATMVATQTVSLLSQTPIAVGLPWAPPQAGAWQLTPRLRLPDGTITAFDPVGVAVQPAPAADASALAAVSTWPAHLPLVALVLTACAGLAALVGWRGWPMSPAEEGDDA